MHKQLNYNLVWQVPSYSLGQSLGYGDNKTGSLWANCVQMGPSRADVRGGGACCAGSAKAQACYAPPTRCPLRAPAAGTRRTLVSTKS